MLKYRCIKARPHDLDVMMEHEPELVEIHCSIGDLKWMPDKEYETALAVHVPEYDLDGTLLDPASLDEDKRIQAEKVYVQAAGRAAAWAPFFRGKPKIVFHPGGHSPGERDDVSAVARRMALKQTSDAMVAKAGDWAHVLLENLPRSCWFFGGSWKANIVATGEDLSRFAEALGLGVTLDLCHLYLACQEDGLDFIDQIHYARRNVRHVHWSDAKGTDQEGLQIGEGDLPIVEAFNALQGVDAYAVPEIWFGHEHGGAAFVKAWELLEEKLDLAGVRA